MIARDPSGSRRVGNARAPLRFLGNEVEPRVSWQVGNSQARFKESPKNSARLDVVTVDQLMPGAGAKATGEADTVQ